MKVMMALGLFSEILVYFCVGFTTLAILNYCAHGSVDMSQSVIVGAALGTFQVINFMWDMFLDRRDMKKQINEVANG